MNSTQGMTPRICPPTTAYTLLGEAPEDGRAQADSQNSYPAPGHSRRTKRFKNMPRIKAGTQRNYALHWAGSDRCGELCLEADLALPRQKFGTAGTSHLAQFHTINYPRLSAEAQVSPAAGRWCPTSSRRNGRNPQPGRPTAMQKYTV